MDKFYIFSKRSGGPLCADTGQAIFFNTNSEVNGFINNNHLSHNDYEIHYGKLVYEGGQIYYQNIQEKGVILSW